MPGDIGPLTELVTLSNSQGSVRLDNTSGWRLHEGPEGRFMPPVALEMDEPPGEPGGRIRSIRHRARELVIPITLDADDPATARAALRTMLRFLDPTRGDSAVRIRSPLGDERELLCRYVSGLEGDEGNTDPALTEYRFSIKMRAPWPYWTDLTDETQAWSSGVPVSFFPFLPLNLSGSQVIGNTAIDNAGDVESWPVWTITGPGNDFVARNLTTGRVLRWSGTLLASEVLTIDTRPGQLSTVPKTVRLQDGTNQFGSLSERDLWPLAAGVQTVQVELAAATGASAVQMAWRQNWLGA